jgi:hypothetical protein
MKSMRSHLITTSTRTTIHSAGLANTTSSDISQSYPDGNQPSCYDDDASDEQLSLHPLGLMGGGGGGVEYGDRRATGGRRGQSIIQAVRLLKDWTKRCCDTHRIP